MGYGRGQRAPKDLSDATCLSFPFAPPTHRTLRVVVTPSQTDFLLRAREPRELYAYTPCPPSSVPSPPLTSQATEPRPTDGCACAHRRLTAPPPGLDACADVDGSR
ncbi:hypothetical protein J0S82_005963 [Galemys pyrenaicus]|uniref:Uncharacterized protein n=1 Tax=Galemys pyrenaicus TaxID=202257 RepID=A0A8J6AHK2_GALPY|nr:hypothetical protein J0S82_005963 [Galemys pyrenaicus]